MTWSRMTSADASTRCWSFSSEFSVANNRFHVPQKRSKGFRSGAQGGYASGTLRPTQRRGNCYLKTVAHFFVLRYKGRSSSNLGGICCRQLDHLIAAKVCLVERYANFLWPSEGTVEIKYSVTSECRFSNHSQKAHPAEDDLQVVDSLYLLHIKRIFSKIVCLTKKTKNSFIAYLLYLCIYYY